MELLLCSHSLSLRSFSMTPLRRRMLEDMQIRNLSAGTQAIYLAQVSQFARYFSDGDGAGGQLFFLGEMELVSSNLLFSQNIGWLAEIASELRDLRQIDGMGPGGQITNLHVFQHATAKRCHGKAP